MGNSAISVLLYSANLIAYSKFGKYADTQSTERTGGGNVGKLLLLTLNEQEEKMIDKIITAISDYIPIEPMEITPVSMLYSSTKLNAVLSCYESNNVV